MDVAMRTRIKDPSVPFSEVMAHVRALQGYRVERGTGGRLDERVGKPLDRYERVIADVLVAEGRNVTVLARPKNGGAMPDLAVDGEAAEIKTSISDNAQAFAMRVRKVPELQGTGLVFVNMVPSGIAPESMIAELSALVVSGLVAYIRIIGDGIEMELGRWS